MHAFSKHRTRAQTYLIDDSIVCECDSDAAVVRKAAGKALIACH